MVDNRFPPGGYYGSGTPEYGQGSDSAEELLRLIDALEALIGAAVRIPWINKVLLDREELLDIVDQARVTVSEPTEIEQTLANARTEAAQILADAQAKADEITRGAQQEAYARLSETDQVKAAQTLARDIIIQARDDANGIRHDADNYALEVLTRLERELTTQLGTIRGGVRTLQSSLRNGSQPPDDIPPDDR